MRSVGGGFVVLLSVLASCGKDPAPETTPPATPPPSLELVPVRRVVVAHRGSKPPADRSREEAEARAREVRRLLGEPGASFDEIAKAWSDDRSTALAGGFAGFEGPVHAILPDVAKTLSALAPGEISAPIEIEGAYHVIQRLSREDGRALEARVVAPITGFLVAWRRDGKTEAYAVAADAVRSLRGGSTFEEAMQNRATGGVFREALKAGNAAPGWEALERAAMALAPGEWADPVETPDGWAVVRRDPHFRAHLKHVLVAHSMSRIPSPPPRGRATAGQRAREALAKVRADRGAWDAVVAEYSEEPGTRARGGSMGDVTNAVREEGRIPPEFEAAVATIPPGALSPDVIETRFGFHVVWRVD